MPSFKNIVDDVISKSDIVLEVLDARFIEQTRNKRLEKRAKVLIHVINKCDFVDKKILDKEKRHLKNCVFISAKNHLGTTLLKNKIIELAKKHKIRKPVVGVVGYPNVGKSSLINALKGKSSAKTSPEAGYTKSKQYLKIHKNILMIDTPGVIPRENNKDLVLMGAKNPSNIEDPDLEVMNLMEKAPEFFKKYGVTLDDKEKAIEEIALKFNLKKKGNLPDIDRASRKILQDWLKS